MLFCFYTDKIVFVYIVCFTNTYLCFMVQIWLGAGTRPGGLQHKSFYQIDKLSDEYVSISASHGTPVYVTAIVENYAGLRATFYSQKLMVDHTPPEVKDINVTIQSVHGSNKVHNASYDDETTVHLTATWNVSDPESGVKMCFTSVGESQFYVCVCCFFLCI